MITKLLESSISFNRKTCRAPTIMMAAATGISGGKENMKTIEDTEID